MKTTLLEQLGLSGLDIGIVLIVLFLLIIIGWVIAILALSKYAGLNKKYQKFMGGNEAKALESYITELIALNKDNSDKIEENKAEIRNLYKKQRLNFQKVGMIKYDALQEMGGNLSFAIALLDENNDGFILNSVHNIHSNYCYAKEVKEGKCILNLSEEETIALEKALTSNKG